MCECRECVSVCVWADAGACHARGPDAHVTGGKCVCVCERVCVCVCVWADAGACHARGPDAHDAGGKCVCVCVCVRVCVCVLILGYAMPGDLMRITPVFSQSTVRMHMC